MAAQKTTPYMSILAYPFEAQTRYGCRVVALSDQLCNLDKGEVNDAGYTGFGGSAIGTMPVTGSSQGGHILDAQNLQWWDLFDEVDKTRLAGYTLSHNTIPLNCVLQNENKLNPPTDVVSMVWKPSTGQEDHWQTCLPDREPLACGIRFSAVDMGKVASAVTDGNLPAGQPFRVELTPIGVARAAANDLQPWLRLSWNGRYCAYLAAGRKPELGRIGSQGNRASANQYGHTALRTLDYLAGFWDYQTVSFDVVYLGGRLVLSGSGSQTIYTDRVRNSGNKDQGDKEGRVRPAEPPAGPLQIQSQGVAFTLRIHEIGTGTTERKTEGVGATTQEYAVTSDAKGSFKRKFFATQRPKLAVGYAYGYHPSATSSGSAERHPERMAKVTINTGDADRPFSGEATYTCELQARNIGKRALAKTPWREDIVTYDGNTIMRGQKSPLIHSVAVQSEPVWKSVSTMDPAELRGATNRAKETCADPALQTGLSWEVQLDRIFLPDLSHPSGGSLGYDWDQYVGQYRPIRIFTGWNYTDGTIRAYGPNKAQVGMTSGRFFGIQEALAPGMPSHNKRPLTVTARDPIMLLQAPHGVIDGSYAAFDFLFASKCARSSPDRKTALFGADCVKYILETKFGPTGSDLYVYYPGYHGLWNDDARPDSRYQWSLYDYLLYTDPPSGSGLLWPPPFGSAELDWIQKVCEADFTVFYYALDWGNPGRDVQPTYGNYFEIVRAAPTTRIPDAEYLQGDADIAALAADWRQVTEQDYNRWLIWGTPPGGAELGGIMPAIPAFSAESTPMDNSTRLEQRPSLTWERTKVLQGPQFYMPGVARMIVRMARALMFGVEVRRVTIKHRGIDWLWWGQKVTIDATGPQSDPALDFRKPSGAQQTFRVMRVVNDYDLDRGTWNATTSLADQPVGW